MNILYITELNQSGTLEGPAARTLDVLRRLAQNGHRLSLVVSVCEEGLAYIGPLKDICAEVYALPQSRSPFKELLSWLRSLISGKPFLVELSSQGGARRLIQGLLSSQTYDVIHTDQISMVQFALLAGQPHTAGPRAGLIPATGDLPKRPALLFDSHDDPGLIEQRILSSTLPILQPLLAGEMKRVQRYEAEVARLCDHAIAARAADLDLVYERIASSAINPKTVSLA